MTSLAQRIGRDWLITAGALVLSALLLALGGGRAPSKGDRVPVALTIIPADEKNLGCSSSAEVSGLRCAFDGEGKPVAVTHPLRPFVTLGRELVLISNLFELDSVEEFLTRARKKRSNERVTLRCKAELLGTLRDFGVHWQAGEAFEKTKSASVLRASECRVEER
ncbi:MAG: hypothetical protein M3020_07370 [Myxococcota bacterium]|nr:hypothetical protein [Myxococcota bacterium]